MSAISNKDNNKEIEIPYFRQPPEKWKLIRFLKRNSKKRVLQLWQDESGKRVNGKPQSNDPMIDIKLKSVDINMEEATA